MHYQSNSNKKFEKEITLTKKGKVICLEIFILRKHLSLNMCVHSLNLISNALAITNFKLFPYISH